MIIVRRGVSRVRLAFLAGLMLAVALGCSQRDDVTPTNDNVWMVSEKREIEIGDKVAAEIEREYPVYQSDELHKYVNQIGQTLAAVCDRRNLTYKFRVLDSPIANAFATPGGHIYITRGLLGVMEDEAELAGVVGHEIGHVAARHSAKQMQGSTLASIGLVAAVLLAGKNADPEVFRAADAAASLIFLGYSRSDEDQADILGVKYLYRAGYDPEGTLRGLEGLMELDRRNPMKAEQFFRSHPLTQDRVEHVRQFIPRIPREDVWSNGYPGTNLKGEGTYARLAVPHAQYPGGEEMYAVIENFRIGLIRKQARMIEKCLADEFTDDEGRTKDGFLSAWGQVFSTSEYIDYKISEVDVEPRKDGGAARMKYTLKIRDRNTGTVREENGTAYMEFSKPLQGLFKMTSLRQVRNS